MRLGLKGLSFRKPNKEQMEACAESASRDGPNHLLVGASQSFEPEDGSFRLTRFVDGWIEDYDATKIGEGQQDYLSAREAVRTWQHTSLGWVDTNRPPVKFGSGVCIAAKMLCFWQRNPLQVVYVTEDADTETRAASADREVRKGRSFAFGQTTLTGHALAGEESFTVRWKPDNSVWYEVYAFSQAKTVLALAAYPVRRFFQHKFRRDSARKMAMTVQQKQNQNRQKP